MREETDAKKDAEKTTQRDRRNNNNRRNNFRKKVCRFCAQHTEPDYKNPDQLRRYTTERGKILPARITGNCAKHQRAVTAEIKKARVLAYLPFEKK
ncbi:MAG: 30S ribosomal protein S18 [Spirochaetia bacterium]|jgi:small subunit ribosomal protein S18|nr:30S ribosomal protein S18 [Spirochaetia bacterium]